MFQSLLLLTPLGSGLEDTLLPGRWRWGWEWLVLDSGRRTLSSLALTHLAGCCPVWTGLRKPGPWAVTMNSLLVVVCPAWLPCLPRGKTAH